MKLEVLVSTMYQKDFSLVKKMNIQTDAVIINQSDNEHIEELYDINKNIRIKMFTYKERGLSKSRNKAIDNSKADICILADDDVVYKDNYADIVIEAYQKYSDADIIAFNVPSTNNLRPTSTLKEGDVNFIKSMKISSFQITFKRKSFIDNSIKFNENFGAGAKYICGEENILLVNCLKKGLKIKYVNQDIAIVNHNESTWFKGFNEKFFKTKGAMFYEMSPTLSKLLILQFGIRKYNLYKNEMTFIKACKYMFDGLKEYKTDMSF